MSLLDGRKRMDNKFKYQSLFEALQGLHLSNVDCPILYQIEDKETCDGLNHQSQVTRTYKYRLEVHSYCLQEYGLFIPEDILEANIPEEDMFAFRLSDDLFSLSKGIIVEYFIWKEYIKRRYSEENFMRGYWVLNT